MQIILGTEFRSVFLLLVYRSLGNLPKERVAMSGMGLGVFEEFADYILGTENRVCIFIISFNFSYR